jgi:Ran-binding protein 3
VETGEEEEETIFSCRARLYHFDKEWKERGTGNVKVNVRYEQKTIGDKKEKDEEDSEARVLSYLERKARVVMRADGVHRVILNSPVFKDMKVGTNEGTEPDGKTMFLTGLEDGQPRLFRIRVRGDMGLLVHLANLYRSAKKMF